MNPKPSSLDFYAFTAQYAKLLEGSFIKKVYQTAETDFVFQLYGSSSGKNYILISLKKGLMFDDSGRPEEATPLSMLLRKILSERRIVGVEQINFDRVVKFTLHTGQEIILEIFREGNLIVTNSGLIEFATEQREWRNRKITKGQPYVPPSTSDPLSFDDARISEVLSDSKASTVQTLATRMNLGGDLAEELLFRAGIDKNLPSSQAAPLSATIRTALAAILKESTAGGAYYYEKAKLLSPIEMKHLSGSPDGIYAEFNQAIVEYSKLHFHEDEKEDQLSRRIESMRRSITEFEAKRDQYSRLGTTMMSDLPNFDGIILQLKRITRNGGRIEPGTSVHGGKVRNYDPARRMVELSLDGQEIELNIDKTAGQNASEYFGRSKEFRSKIEGALRAIEETNKMVIRQSKPVRKSRKKEWFEAYHWFFSSEGFLVIAGRDAKSNERIVKRHLKDHDIYVHAEVYGAPSTVVKIEGDSTPGEETLREACNFAVAFSRAWAAGLSSGSAYWVLPSQVSKTPESGEFVSTGSWIVRGKRNYFFDLPMELHISIHEHRDSTIPMIHPAFGDADSGNPKTVTISPGEVKRSSIAQEIAKKLGVDREEIEGILPPGNSQILQ